MNIFGWLGMITAQWLMKRQEETNTGHRDGQTVAEGKRDRKISLKYRGCRAGNTVFFCRVVILKMEMDGQKMDQHLQNKQQRKAEPQSN